MDGSYWSEFWWSVALRAGGYGSRQTRTGDHVVRLQK